MGANAQGGGLKRQLGFGALVAYGLAYIAPVAPLSTLGIVWQASEGLIALSYLLGGLCMGFTALSYAAMVREVRTAGSVYGFARAVLGPFAGFMAGWLILLDYLMIPAFVYVVMAVALEQLMPGVDRAVWIVALVGFASWVNWYGVKSTATVSMASVLVQAGAVLLLVGAAGLAVWRARGAAGLGLAPVYHAPFHIGPVLAGTSICVMSFLGFDAVSTLAEDTADRSGRTLGRAILAVLLLSTVFFVGTAFVLGNAMVGMQIHNRDAAAYELAGQIGGPRAGLALAWFYALVVGFTNALPMQVGVARVLYAMGRDGQLPAFLARLHPRHNTPHVAMILSSSISLVVALWMRGDMDRLASFVNFGALMGFALLHLCVVMHFRRRPVARRWGMHVISPVLGVAVVGAILMGMNAQALWLGLGWLGVGLAYGAMRARRQGHGPRA